MCPQETYLLNQVFIDPNIGFFKGYLRSGIIFDAFCQCEILAIRHPTCIAIKTT